MKEIALAAVTYASLLFCGMISLAAMLIALRELITELGGGRIPNAHEKLASLRAALLLKKECLFCNKPVHTEHFCFECAQKHGV